MRLQHAVDSSLEKDTVIEPLDNLLNQTMEEWIEANLSRKQQLDEMIAWLDGKEQEGRGNEIDDYLDVSLPFPLPSELPVIPVEDVVQYFQEPVEESTVMSHVRVISQRECHIRHFNMMRIEFVLAVNDKDLTFGMFYELFTELINWINSDFQPEDWVGTQLSMEGLRRDVSSTLHVWMVPWDSWHYGCASGCSPGTPVMSDLGLFKHVQAAPTGIQDGRHGTSSTFIPCRPHLVTSDLGLFKHVQTVPTGIQDGHYGVFKHVCL